MAGKPDKSCWAKRTPMQIALILVLSIGVPILMVLVVIYILFGTAWGYSEQCSNLCDIATGKWRGPFNAESIWMTPDSGDVPSADFEDYWEGVYKNMNPTTLDQSPKARMFIPAFKPKDIAVNTISDKVTQTEVVTELEEDLKTTDLAVDSDNSTTTASPPDDDRLRFPSIAAILENLYLDDSYEKRILCPSVVLSTKWVLSTRQCLQNHFNRSHWLSIRSMSDYWSTGGSVVSIEKIIPFKQLAAVKVSSPLADAVPVQLPDEAFFTQTNPGAVVRWNANLSRPLAARRKHSKLDSIAVTLFYTAGYGDLGEACWGESPVLDPSGRFLLGFQLAVRCEEKLFPFLNTVAYRDLISLVLSTK